MADQEPTTQVAEALVCGECQHHVYDDEGYTVCRSCKDVYHLECAQVVERSPKFGCIKCYAVPGNLPRIRHRPMERDEQADPHGQGVPAPGNAEAGGQRPSLGGETMEASHSPRRGSVCGSEDSVGSSRRSRRDDRLADAIQQ